MKKFTLIALTAILTVSLASLSFGRSIAKPEYKQVSAKEITYWLNTDSMVRHNSKCRWYGKTKKGRYTKKKEGRACKVCGG